MPNYSKGVIYTVRTGDSVYVGSTTNFRQRKCCHKSSIYNENSKEYNKKLYQKIRENGEWDMKPYKKYSCESKLQLHIEEEKVRRELNADLNSQSCGTGLSKSEYHKQYHIDNKDKNAEYQKQYAIDNKDKLKEQRKQFRIDNKEKVRERENKKTKCECGCIVIRMARHKKSKKHLDLMEKINSD